MVVKTQLEEIAQALASLPAEKIAAVHDYVLFLKNRYGNNQEALEYAWKEEELKELSEFVLRYGDETIPWNPSSNQPNEGGENQ